MFVLIYLDNAATTPIHPDVVAAMMPYLTDHFGNASSIHAFGRRARAAIEAARADLAALIHCQPDEIVFTSGGTEADQSALVGAFLAARETTNRTHVVVTAIEHHAVLDTCDLLRRLGAQVSLIAPQPDGIVRVADVLSALRPDTVLVSVMGVNNELGTVQPVEQVAAAVKAVDARVLVHSDQVQALAALPVSLTAMGIDLASFSAHKVHGPKGVGALYVRRKTHWQPAWMGGAQERQRRGGTENVPGIVGFGAAAKRLHTGWAAHEAAVLESRQAFLDGLNGIQDVRWNSPENAVPGILNLAFADVRADALLMRLDVEGVAASAGSACTAGSLQPSHVLLACGRTEAETSQAVRFSFSELTDAAAARTAGNVVRRVVEELRRIGKCTHAEIVNEI